MRTFTFTCDETMATLGGVKYALYGEFEVRYALVEAEPDVGLMSAGAEEVGIADKSFTLRLFNPETEADSYITFTRGSAALQELETALEEKLSEKACESAGECDYHDYED